MDDSLLSSLDQSWKNFSGAWKSARTKSSEKAIHDLRVNTRRLIAILDLAKAVSGDAEIAKLQRRFKKVLKRMGPLRDTQVLLVNLSRIQQRGLVGDFKKTLEQKERREIDGIRDELSRGRKQKLSKAVEDVRGGVCNLQVKLGREKVHRSIDRVLSSRRNELLKAERRFHRSQPISEDLLHAMRIALKKFRYVIEAAQPLLDDSTRQRAKEMHAFQQLIGESRDVELLRTALEKWANKRGKVIAVVPALDRLQEKRDNLLKKIFESLTELEQTLTGTLKPVVEKTHAIGTAATEPPKEDFRKAAAAD
ncbi:MAG TPA: CHAD domain-containing protein [Terriglobia bacterium]|nr:CHAD domain-containing protein [Terriglobia bacterium]